MQVVLCQQLGPFMGNEAIVEQLINNLFSPHCSMATSLLWISEAWLAERWAGDHEVFGSNLFNLCAHKGILIFFLPLPGSHSGKYAMQYAKNVI
jgi:hypothetical protein